VNKLILLRHSKAEPIGAVGDASRELTPQGRRKCSLLAKKLRKRDIELDAIISSHATRALQTAELIGQVLDYNGVITKYSSIYHDDYDAIINIVHDLPKDVKNVLLVGHIPTIYESAYWFASQDLRGDFAKVDYSFSTCGGIILESGKDWDSWGNATVNKGKLVVVNE
jgi:phosphohistidine phosphatase